MFWLLANPVSLIKTPGDLTYHYAFIYFSIITAIYSLVTFRKPGEGFPDNLVLTVLLLAGIAYSVLLLSLVFIHFPTAYVPFFIAISIYCIAYSVILKLYSPWKYSPAFLLLFGFVAISVYCFWHLSFSRCIFIADLPEFPCAGIGALVQVVYNYSYEYVSAGYTWL